MFLLFYFQASQPNNEFIITFKKGAKKTDSMRFSSDQRAAIITEAMRWVIIRKYLTYIDSFPDTDTSLEKGRLCPSSGSVTSCTGQIRGGEMSSSWYLDFSHDFLPSRSVVLVAGPTGLEQKDPSSNKLLATYFYKDIEGVSEVSDYPGGFVITKSHFGRMHMFASEGETKFSAN